MLFEKFFIDFHNSVNYRLGKPLLPESVARKKMEILIIFNEFKFIKK